MHILPQLKSLEHKFTVEDGLVVIGVHSPKFSNERSTDNVRAAVERYEITHPVVNDHGEDLWSALGICCWPTLVIVGPNGELLLYLMGESHEKLLHLFVKEALTIFKERGQISPHPIPEISVHNQYRQPSLLYFPGKVCTVQTLSGYLLAVADTGHHRILIIDSNGNVQ
ncbi:NHL repeat-containing protein 2, partial [Homalodisca vitripennis]